MRKVYGLSSPVNFNKIKSFSQERNSSKDNNSTKLSKQPNKTYFNKQAQELIPNIIDMQVLTESKVVQQRLKSEVDSVGTRGNFGNQSMSPKNSKILLKKSTIDRKLPNESKNINQQSLVTQYNESKMMGSGSLLRYDSKIVSKIKSEQYLLKTKSNIRTFARFRPLSALEKQLSDTGIGSLACNFVSENQVLVKNPTDLGFTLDKIYPPDESQQKIYQDVGRQIISEIFNGYNGTLFAYGQTGSGKTYTMYGNMDDQKHMGIIPRAVKDLFEHIEFDQGDQKRYIITCSILQIYKQTLYDLIVGGKTNLKIKQSPVKGIYVEGLQQFPVSTQQELNQIITTANQNKSVRSTKMNQYSSRSHTILMLEVTQQFGNGAEKKGKLNLVDLAGSEKLSKSGSVGESLEEAKKINLSLSCLGNVIHSLTNHNEHIPYRDSKLTRLLQESLGGNYKTYLIATCSMHSSNIEQTISTLKFATRVKSIKNNFKVNVVSSNISLRIIIAMQKKQIEELKAQLTRIYKLTDKLRQQIAGYKICPPSMSYLLDEIQQSYAQFQKNCAKNKLSELFQNEKFMKSFGIRDIEQLNSLKKQIQQTYFNEDSLKVSNQPNKQSDQLSVGSINKIHKQTTHTKAASEQKDQKIKQLEREIVQLKKSQILQEKKIINYQEEKAVMESKYQKQLNRIEFSTFQTEVLQKQIEALVNNICKNESLIEELLIQKQSIINKKFEQFANKKLEFTEIKLGEYFKNSINFNFDKQISNKSSKASFIGALDFKKFISSDKDVFKKHITIDARIESLQTLFSGKENSKQAIIYCLKKDLINAQIINQHLVRTLSALEWKQVIEYGKAKLKTNMSTTQAQTIEQLQKVLAQSCESHRILRNKIQKLQFEYNYGDNQSTSKKPKIIVPINNHKKQDNIAKDSTHRNESALSLDNVIPEFKDIKKKVLEISKQIMPITYENVVSILKERNKFILVIWENLHRQQFTNLIKKGHEMVDNQKSLRQLRKQNDRLASKVNSLQSQLHIELAKSEQFKAAYLVSQDNIAKLKALSEQLEISLRNNLKQENESWEQTVSSLREMHSKEMQRRTLQDNRKVIEQSRRTENRGINITSSELHKR